ncbi:hypothetical protein HBI56_137640 [Parastagonospora nodorum]|nr:hypothetical protein HBH51_116850 [Parastagonospora nodorum]KAH3996342.1 hypothetical protein HBI10_158280 [Parastagonospora nodorum]KAH4018912.1 hypothetical protein HBI13_127810 [Parastagonospora nodorum]KAH4052694.1 hypothetical protein HBH49_105130 [Parastagonospora nodorum]KAH4097523.1 hypothetical protein HBH46_159090 [Parastagonospora nodorum]
MKLHLFYRYLAGLCSPEQLRRMQFMLKTKAIRTSGDTSRYKQQIMHYWRLVWLPVETVLNVLVNIIERRESPGC